MSRNTDTRSDDAKRLRADSVPEREPPRREFLRGVARAAALGGLGAAGAVLARRAMKTSAGGCANRGVCPTCAESAACPLPQGALARRRARGK